MFCRHHLKIISNCPIFPCQWQRLSSAHWHHPNRRLLIPFPRTYFEVKDIRPGEDELSGVTDKIFELTAGGITITKALNQKNCSICRGKICSGFQWLQKRPR